MIIKKHFLSIAIVIVMIAALLAGCGGGQTPSSYESDTGTGTVELVCATTGMTGASELYYLEEFKRLAEEQSGGSLTVTIYPDSQLGSDVDTTESLLSGEIAAVTLQPSAVVTFVSEFAAFDYPNLFSGYTKDQIHEALSGEFFDLVSAAAEDNGLKILSFAQGASFREMSCNKPINSVADFQGVSIRTLENPNHMNYWRALGASPTPLAWSEVYVSLQQGLVDAQENGYEVVLNGTLYEVQDYIINTDHILMVNVLMFSPTVYDSLTPEQQQIVDQAARDAAVGTNDRMETANIELRDELIAKGVTIIDLPADVISQMRELTIGVYDDITANIGAEYLEAIRAGLEK